MNKTSFNPGALNEFLAESQDQLEKITLLLSPGEGIPVSTESIHSIYRELHTLKGNAQLFGCTALASVAHTLESSIDSARRRGEGLYPDLTDEVFKGLGLLELMVKALQTNFAEGDYTAEIARLVTSLAAIISRNMQGGELAFGKDGPAATQTGIQSSPLVEKTSTPLAQPPIEAIASPSSTLPPLPQAPVEAIPALQPPAPSEGLAKTPELIEGDKKPASNPQNPESHNETLRVQVNLLDSLMNLVGELVLVRNQVIQKSNSQSEDAEFVNLSQRLDVITTELQNEIMKTRMQPIGTILTKFHRLIRDMARDLGKDINLKLEGTETELDKTLIEAVKDPLTHIIRNSIDHGIESRDERSAKNKAKSGTIQIRAFHEGGQIVIEISDDGRGLQRHKIGNKAVERGLITLDQFKKMTDREVCNLIFLPGFSTAEKVSNISGRGVGLDVVRTNIEKIGGLVDISSVEGQGSTMRLKIPLTLAIVPALLVKTDGQMFAIPQVKLTELVRLQNGNDQSENRIEYLQGQAVFRLRGRLLPLVSLQDILGIENPETVPLKERDDISIVVLQADAGVFGLVVDEIDDSTDIVVKSLSGFLKNLSVYSGATVLGDGSVALVLDVIGLADQGHIFNETREIESQNSLFAASQPEEITEYLLIDVALEGQYCIPLYVVNRLEEFPTSAIEHTADQLVVRYRGSILPLIDLPTTIGAESAIAATLGQRSYCSVIVVQQSDNLYGLVVDNILDIIGMSGPINEQIRNKECLLGTKIYGDHVVSIIDAFKVIEHHFPLLNQKNPQREVLGGRPIRVLYAEDSEFFQKQMTNMLKAQGYRVTCASNGEEALARLIEEGEGAYDVLVSDIDMPKLDGLGLIEKLRSLPEFRHLPAFALSSRVKSLTEKIAVKSGFDLYIEKSDVARLIESIQVFTDQPKEVKRGA